MNKNYSLAAYITSFAVLILFFLLGLILTIFFIQNLFLGFSGFGLLQILFFAIGIYLIYKPIRHMMFLSHAYDHRIIDGALGGSFLRRVADYLEQFDVNTSI